MRDALFAICVLWLFFFVTCACFRDVAVDEEVKGPRVVSITMERIVFAFKVCKGRKRVKLIQLEPRPLIICSDGAVFYK